MDILNYIATFLYPPRCPLCRRYLPDIGSWCSKCMDSTIQAHIIAIDQWGYQNFHRIWALGRYHGVLRRLIIQLKYGGRKSTLPYLGSFIETAIKNIELPEDIDIVICVPLHQNRLKERGFNQTELIFKKWLAKKHFKCENNLERIFFTQAQYKLRRQERLKNLQHAFSFKKGMTVSGKNCLLLDDIYTTGATLSACAKVLKQHGAAKIYGLVLATDAE
ncbi:ComF family protein [Pectinatus frisingensis]|uniref:ComF family protein n=1 Tax=Pectinatus frisingensis TaxID=865 RepID=UPI0018C75468|nr:ComF family protein [Pectinatus frisingensis]